MTTDFNYYAVCRNLLSGYASDIGLPGGLLHDTPRDVDEAYGLNALLNECAKPTSPGNRLKTKEKLMATLKELTKKLF